MKKIYLELVRNSLGYVIELRQLECNLVLNASRRGYFQYLDNRGAVIAELADDDVCAITLRDESEV